MSIDTNDVAILSKTISDIAGLVGPAGTAIGFVSWLLERRKRLKAELDFRRRTWSQISKATGLMNDLEKDIERREGYENTLQAIGKLSFMLRDLIMDACSTEKRLSVETIEFWRKTGKLSSDWQQKLALALLLTEEITSASAQAVSDKFRNWDELPDNHPCFAENVESRVKRNSSRSDHQNSPSSSTDQTAFARGDLPLPTRSSE